MEILEVAGIYKSFGGVQAVRGCDFTVSTGSVTGLIGPNGAGKSTMIDIIAGFQKPDQGTIRFAGRAIQRLPAYDISRLGLIRTFQNSREWPKLTVMENMLVAAPPAGRETISRALLTPGWLRSAEEQDRVAARRVLGSLNLINVKDERAGNLSGGQKRLLEFARILIARPKMVLLDEPSAGVHPLLRDRIGEAIEALRREGITVLLVEHNLPFVERTCSSVIVMSLGRRIATGSMEELQRNKAVVDAYLGDVDVSPSTPRGPAAAWRPDDAKTVLKVSGLTAGYGGPPIIEEVSCTAWAGHMTAIVGPNGAGKSTLLKAILGSIPVTAGSVLLDGIEAVRQSPHRLVRRGIAYVPQVNRVFPSLSVIENLEMGGYVRQGGVRQRAEELLEMFPDLKIALRRPAGTLSGGQVSMLAIARALMVDPSVLLMDEPTAGLSPKFADVVWEKILLVRDRGVAVVVVEQNTRRTLRYADWAYVMTLGRNRIDGRGADLLENEEVVKLYIGRTN